MKCNYEVVTYLPQSKGTLKKSQSPPKSWGHTLNMYRGYLILFGGNNKSTRKRDSDLYSIDATNLMFNEWINFVPTEVDKEKNLIMPDSRDTHTANIIDHELYVVCGNNNGKCSEIWIFDFRKNNCKYPGWTCDPLGREMAIEGQSVEARESHVTMTYLNRFLVIYGGVTVTQSDYMVEIVDTKLAKIRKLKNSELLNNAPFLESHSCTLISGKYYIYGGAISKPEEVGTQDGASQAGTEEQPFSQNQLYRVDIQGENLEDIVVDFQKIPIKGEPPCLDEHTAVGLYDRFLVLLGGSICIEKEGQSSVSHNKDVFVIDIEKEEIFIAENIGKTALKPCTASAATTDGKNIFMYGGIEPTNVYSKTLSIINVRFSNFSYFQDDIRWLPTTGFVKFGSSFEIKLPTLRQGF